jgi:hypothetical protein
LAEPGAGVALRAAAQFTLVRPSVHVAVVQVRAVDDFLETSLWRDYVFVTNRAGVRVLVSEVSDAGEDRLWDLDASALGGCLPPDDGALIAVVRRWLCGS